MYISRMHKNFMPREVTVGRPGGKQTFRVIYEFEPVGFQHGAVGLTAPTAAILTGNWTAYPQQNGGQVVEGMGFFASQIVEAIDVALEAAGSFAA